MKKTLIVLLFSFVSLFAFEELNSNNFKEKTNKGKIIVDFHSPYWGACKVLGQNLQKFNDTSKANDVKIYKLNVLKHGDISKEYGLIGVPAIIMLKDGKVVFKRLGVFNVSQLESLQKEHF